MAQIKIYALKANLANNAEALSEAIHAAVMRALAYPQEKRFHRFIGLEKSEFVYPADRSESYTIIEISMFEGRSVATKKQLISSLFEHIERSVGIQPQDVEITIHETPKHNWGIRGKPGDELALSYKVEV